MKNLITLVAILATILVVCKLSAKPFVEAVDFQNNQSERYHAEVCETAWQSPELNKGFLELNCQ